MMLFFNQNKPNRCGRMATAVLLASSIGCFGISPNSSMLFAAPKVHLNQNQQQATVTGRVSDQAGTQGLPSVNVRVKGTQNGTTTDADGRFQLNNVPADGVLVFTAIGYQTVEEQVNNREVIGVAMLEDMASLSEVVVVGYGTQKKETITGSVTSISTKELVKTPTTNLSNALAGRTPGLIVTQPSAEPGADNAAMLIRGTNTLGNSSPLVVIDGIPAREGGLERINPADIESMSVLKDAAAAIYGARAANGVILITTKRGAEGKPTITYNFNQGFSGIAVIPELADAAQYAEMRNDLEVYKLPVAEWQDAHNAFRTQGSFLRPNGTTINAPFTPESMNLFRDGSDPWGHPNTDWYGETIRNFAPQARHNLQITGGSENFKFLTSLGYQDQDAVYKNSATSYQQYDLRVNLDARISKYINTQIGVLGRQEDRNFPTKSAGTIFRMLMRGNPTQPAFWPNGMPGPDIENGENPVVITTDQTGYDRGKRYYFQTNGQIEISQPWIEGLKFVGTAAVDKFIEQNKRWETPWFLYTWQGAYEDDGVTPQLTRGQRGPADPRLNQSNEDQLNVLLGGILNYERTFNNDHNVTVMAGINRETIRNDHFSAYRRYFISSLIDQMDAGGDYEKDNGGGAWEQARLNYFGRAGYNFKGKYIGEFLWRFDGSYMFPQHSRYGFFPGLSAGWLISEENFWKNGVKAVNYLKLRGSWGQLGNDGIEFEDVLQEYQYFATYGFNSYIVNNNMVTSLAELRVPNNAITWEVANNYNVGLDAQLLGGKIDITLDAFLNKRSNILWQRNASIPQSTGMTLPAENLGIVHNRGGEFNVTYNGRAGEFNYAINVNGGYAKNKIIFWDEAPGAPAWQQTTGRVTEAGLYYIYDGVFRDEADIANNALDYSAVTNTLRPGDMKYVDYNGDGRITPEDQVRRNRNNIPTFQGGMNFNLQYKNFDLSILFQGATGGELFISTGESGAIGNYLHQFYEERWTVDNPSSEHPRIADRSDQYFSNDNTYWLQSTDYIRLKNLEFGYTLPAAFGQKIGISNLRLYVSGYNLLTFSGLKAYDPEALNSLGQYYPPARILNTGVSVTF